MGRGGRQEDGQPLQLHSSSSLVNQAKNELHWKMDPKKLDSVLSSFICLPGFLSSFNMNSDHKVYGTRNVSLLSVFSITVIRK